MKVPLTVGDFLERAETVYPDRLAVVDEPGTPGSLGRITYQEMAARARGMALALDRMQVPLGARVALVSPNCSRFMISYFGVSGYGRVLVPVNYRLNADEVSYIVEHSGSTVLLVDPEINEALSGVTAKERIVLDGASEAYLLIDQIKAAGVPVILHPTMFRSYGESENLSMETAAKLHDAGIRVAMQSAYEAYVPKTRVVLFEAALAADLDGTTTALRLTADGMYDAASNTFTAQRITILLSN